MICAVVWMTPMFSVITVAGLNAFAIQARNKCRWLPCHRAPCRPNRGCQWRWPVRQRAARPNRPKGTGWRVHAALKLQHGQVGRGVRPHDFRFHRRTIQPHNVHRFRIGHPHGCWLRYSRDHHVHAGAIAHFVSVVSPVYGLQTFATEITCTTAGPHALGNIRDRVGRSINGSSGRWDPLPQPFLRWRDEPAAPKRPRR